MTTQIRSLFQPTLNALVTSGNSIVNALHAIYAIATSIKDVELAEWAKIELSGYPRDANYPNPRGLSAPAYRLVDIRVGATRTTKNGIRTTSTVTPVDLGELEAFHSLNPGVLSKYFIPNPIEMLERFRGSGTNRLEAPHLRSLLAEFWSAQIPGSTCKTFVVVYPSASFGAAAKGVRVEAIRRLTETGLGEDRLVASPAISVSVAQNNLEQNMSHKSTKIHAPGGQFGSLLINSQLTDSQISVSEQRMNDAPRTNPFGEDESKQFRDDVKEILHLLVDRYEDLDESVANSLQNTLKLLRAVEIQGKTVAELDDLVGDIWAKNEVASMRVPPFVAEAIATTKVLGELVTKFVAG